MSLPSFQQSPCFAVHVLAADQDDLSRRFATKGASKFQRPGGGTGVSAMCR